MAVGRFFLCSPNCPKQPRTSFPFYTTISLKISDTILSFPPSYFQTFRHPWDRAQCGGLTAFQKNGQVGANTVASSRSSINLRFFLDPHPLLQTWCNFILVHSILTFLTASSLSRCHTFVFVFFHFSIHNFLCLIVIFFFFLIYGTFSFF